MNVHSITARLIVSILFIIQINGQQVAPYIKADPYYLPQLEQANLIQKGIYQNLDLRPFLIPGPSKGLNLQISSNNRNFFNDNVPNLENTAELWVGKGLTSFSSVNLSINHKNFFFSIEPYYQYSQNLTFESHHVVRDRSIYNPKIVWKFNVLNDGPGRGDSAVNELRLRETQLYFHYQGIGGGISNAGMWWGPGIHNTLNMTTNTSGFPHLEIGTLHEKRIRQFGINTRYILGELNQNKKHPFFTALLGSITYYGDTIFRLGFIRTFLSGGSNAPEVNLSDAALIPFQSFFKENLYQDDGVYNFGDVDDQTASGYISMLFPSVGLKLFAEYGWNDHRWDWYDLRAHPDHSGAGMIGFRKYGLLGRPELSIGFEYTDLAMSQFYPQRQTPDWYGRSAFFYSTNDGRRYAAHSGSDSDDMMIYLAWLSPERSLKVTFDYERHGIIYSVLLLNDTNAFHFPETKLELQMDYRQPLGKGQLFIYYEYEYAENLGSPAQLISPHVERPVRKANVFGIGFETALYTIPLEK